MPRKAKYLILKWKNKKETLGLFLVMSLRVKCTSHSIQTNFELLKSVQSRLVVCLNWMHLSQNPDFYPECGEKKPERQAAPFKSKLNTTPAHPPATSLYTYSLPYIMDFFFKVNTTAFSEHYSFLHRNYLMEAFSWGRVTDVALFFFATLIESEIILLCSSLNSDFCSY